MSRLLSISKEGDPTISLGNLCQCSHTAQKCCLIFRGNLLCSSLCPLPLVLSLGTTDTSLALSCSTLPSGIEGHWWDPPEPPLLQAEQSQLSQPLFPSLDHLGVPLLESSQYVWVCLALGSPELDPVLQVQPHQCRVEGKDSSLSLLGILGLIQPRMPSAFLVTRHVAGSCPVQCPAGPQALSVKLLSIRVHALVPGAAPRQGQDSALLFVGLHEAPASPLHDCQHTHT